MKMEQIMPLVLALAILVTALTLSASSLYLTRQSSQGAESHAALCVLKADYVQRLDDSRTYLLLTPAARERKYGKALANIPASTIHQSIRNLESSVQSLGALHC